MSTAVAPASNKIPFTSKALRKPETRKHSNSQLATPRQRLLRLPDIIKNQIPKIVDNFVNPFHMPPDQGVIAMREEERGVKVELRQKIKSLKIYEKNVEKRKNFRSLLAEDADDLQFYETMRKRDADKILINQKANVDSHYTKENLHDFIAKKREMFLVQYALGVKRQEMQKLEEIAQAEEQTILDDERALEEDAAKFDAFLKENDKNSVEAIKRAEIETKGKVEKIQEIKKLNVTIMNIRSDMSKNEDQLKDLQRYRGFLDALTPASLDAGIQIEVDPTSAKQVDKSAATKAIGVNKEIVDGDSIKSPDNNEDQWADMSNEPSLYFNSPQQLLDIFSELEENNLSLIQNCQETEETLEDLKSKISATESRMESETQNLKQQINFLTSAITKEEERAKILEDRSKLFSSGMVGANSQEKALDELNHKVKEVYQRCIGDSNANLSTLQMLTSIENKLENLFEAIELMPADKVEQAEKLKDKERRQRLREEKLNAQRLLQEERVQRALERARGGLKKKKIGKPVVLAPTRRKKKIEAVTRKKEEEDDMEYYFGS